MLQRMEDLRFLDHTGDIGFEVKAATIEDLFRRAARGLYEILVERMPAPGGGEEKLELEEEGADLLLRSFLSELLYRFLARRTMFVEFTDLRVEGNRLTARGLVAAFDPDRDGLRTELKAVTYHQLEIRRQPSGWSARVIFDV
ncbi:MAG TPA: archease [Planctomycetota bacterium]|nr:archease [Planctomycetota bacterium]